MSEPTATSQHWWPACGCPPGVPGTERWHAWTTAVLRNWSQEEIDEAALFLARRASRHWLREAFFEGYAARQHGLAARPALDRWSVERAAPRHTPTDSGS